MGKLRNNSLRTKNMVSLLTDMGINLEGTEVICQDELVIFNSPSTEVSNNLNEALNTLLESETSTKVNFKKLSLADLLTIEINSSVSTEQLLEKTHKESCLAVLQVLIKNGLQYSLDNEQRHIEIALPSAVYSSLFAALKYRYLSVSGNTLHFHVKDFLRDLSQEAVIFTDTPLIFMQTQVVESKKIFYAKETLENGLIKVTPHFYIPESPKPPEYHFVLDTSESMKGENLAALKESAIKFAEALFEFQPEAVLNLTEFNTYISSLGSFTKSTLGQFNDTVNHLKAHNSTALFEASYLKLAMLMSSEKHNNVLLFTDGMEQSAFDVKLLENKIDSLENAALIRARNKFFIISYSASQPEILHRLTALFNSPIIYTNTADFVKALSDANKMQEWAALRELFRFQFVVDDTTNTYVCSYDMSGQFAALTPQLTKDGKVQLIIKDGSGNVILEDTRFLGPKAIQPPVDELELVPVVSAPEINSTAPDHVAREAVNEEPIISNNESQSISHSLMHTLWANKKTVLGVTAAVVSTITAYNSL